MTRENEELMKQSTRGRWNRGTMAGNETEGVEEDGKDKSGQRKRGRGPREKIVQKQTEWT